MRGLQRLADSGVMKKGGFLAAKQSTTVSLEFLHHVRAAGLSPATCTQACVDDWLATGPTTRSLARAFVRWAIAHRHMPSLTFPYRVAKTEPVITQQQRLEHIALLIEPGDNLSTDERAAALLLLLYAQPLTRIVSMQLDQVRDEHDKLTISFADEALAVPAPFAAIIRNHLAALPNRNTAAHHDSHWLFPGGRPGQHLHQNTLMIKLRDAGIDLRSARNAAMRALVLELPAPVVADSLNYSYNVTDKHRRNAGATFLDYTSRRTR